MGSLLMPIVIVLCFQLEKVQLFRTLEERFKNHKCVTITLALKDIAWIKKGRELKANGLMFDVKSMRIENGQAVITGFFDDEEEEINKKISRQSEGNNENPGIKILDHYFNLFNSLPNQFNLCSPSMACECPSWQRLPVQTPACPPLSVSSPPPDSRL